MRRNFLSNLIKRPALPAVTSDISSKDGNCRQNLCKRRKVDRLIARSATHRQTAEQIEVTSRSAEELFQPKKAVRSIQIRPLSSLLPKVSPIHDLQIMTKRLQRVDQIYAIANLVAITTLATSLVYTFLMCISVF